ncbi:MAG: endonuclease III [Campylobacterales bacterium]|nr:endonuclease III [Campylobacterales bacterium]
MARMIKQVSKKEISEIKQKLLELYPNSVTELNYTNIYELLVAVMLSAQCTDKRVNIITPEFFKKYPNIQNLASADIDDIKSLINTCSFFNNKAINLHKMANQVINEFGGNIPLTQKELVSLAGVGQKTANVVMLEYTGANVMAVDTHVFRVAHRLGLSKAKTAVKTEEDLTKKFKTDLHRLHQAMVLFGRYHCKAVNPKCEECSLKKECKSNGRFKV